MKKIIPFDLEEKLISLVDQLLDEQGKIKLRDDPSESLGYLVEKIDNNTLIITPDGKLKVLLDSECEPAIYKFNYDNNEDWYPSSVEKLDFNNNLLAREEYTYDNNDVIEIKEYNYMNNKKETTQITYDIINNKKLIIEIKNDVENI